MEPTADDYISPQFQIYFLACTCLFGSETHYWEITDTTASQHISYKGYLMNLEINLEKIAQIAIEKQRDNVSFGNYLKIQDAKKVDEIVHRLNNEITPKISCVDCGNCCRNLRPVATEEAMRPFVKPENIETYKYVKGFECKNLDCNMCTIYEARPEECRQYPYLHRDQFVTRTSELIQNYEVCPIIFNVFERLKTELDWAAQPTKI